MRRHAFLGLLLLGLAWPAAAQIRVDPPGVNVNTQGSTTVFPHVGDFGRIRAREAFGCGE